MDFAALKENFFLLMALALFLTTPFLLGTAFRDQFRGSWIRSFLLGPLKIIGLVFVWRRGSRISGEERFKGAAFFIFQLAWGILAAGAFLYPENLFEPDTGILLIFVALGIIITTLCHIWDFTTKFRANLRRKAATKKLSRFY